MTLVQKMRAFNVDEIDGRCQFHQPLCAKQKAARHTAFMKKSAAQFHQYYVRMKFAQYVR